MSIRLWPREYEKKDHITRDEKFILRHAARNFNNGHLAVGIDPIGLSNEKIKILLSGVLLLKQSSQH